MATAWKNKHGYWMVAAPGHPKAIKGQYYLHRLVMERHFGRILESYEEIHHLLSKDINTPDALVVVYHDEHLRVSKMGL